jgi:uncharacterized protein DUF4340
MKIRGLIVAALVFFVLAGILYWSNQHKPAADSVKASADARPAVLKLDASSITKLDLKKKDAEPIVLTKGESGKWQITAPGPFAADQNVVSGMLSTLSSLNSDRLVEEKTTDLKQYGLNQPVFQIDIIEKDNKAQKLLIGDDTPAGAAVYAMLAGEPRVFTVATYAKTSLDKSLNDLRNKKPFDFGYVEPNRIELHAGSKAILLTRSGEDWLQDGKKMDSASVESLISKLRELAADTFTDSGFVHPTIVVTVTSDEGKRAEKVRIAKSSDGYIAKRDDDPTLYRLNSNSVDDLQKAAEEIKPAPSSVK